MRFSILGNPKLYEESSKVKRDELEGLKSVIEDLADTLMEFRDEYGWGRASLRRRSAS